ncbi:MAG: hypothetical protein AAGA10_25045 [Bacteroidota bacterium]
MSRIVEVKKTAKNLFKVGDWKKCMAYLEEELAEDSQKALDLLDLQASHASYLGKEISGEFTGEFLRTEEARVRNRLLRLIVNLRESDLTGAEIPEGNEEANDPDWQARKAFMEEMYGNMSGRERAKALDEDLIKYIESLQLKAHWTPYDLVNVDREESYKRVRKSWEEKEEKEQDFQFYFLCGCPKQMPDRLAERFFLSLVDHLDDDETSINYPEDAQSGSIQFEYFRLKKSNKVSKAWDGLQAIFEERFKDRLPVNFKLDDIRTSGLLELEEGYILSAFTFNEGDWPEYTGAFFEKVVDTFMVASASDLPPGSAKFLFFFILYFNEFVEEDGQLTANQQQVFSDIRKLIAKHPHKCSMHLGFRPVPYKDAEVWFYELQQARPNQTHIKQVMDTYAFGLPSIDQEAYWQRKEMDMDKMDILQRKIYENKHKPQP